MSVKTFLNARVKQFIVFFIGVVSYFFDGEKQNSGYLFFIRWCDFPFLVLLLMLLFSRAACQC